MGFGFSISKESERVLSGLLPYGPAALWTAVSRSPDKRGIPRVNHPQCRVSLLVVTDTAASSLPGVGVGVTSDVDRDAGKKWITFVMQTRRFSEFRILMLLCKSLTTYFLLKLY